MQTPQRRTIVINEVDRVERRPRIVLSEDDIKSAKPPLLITGQDVNVNIEQRRSAVRTIILNESDFFGHFTEDNYHGTNSGQNIESILQHGWRVGAGNAMGSGVYFAFDGVHDSSSIISTASSYAGSGGALIKATIAWGNTADWYDGDVTSSCMAWLAEQGKSYNGDTITEWGLANGFDSVIMGGFGVMLHPQYALIGTYWKTPRIQITEVYYVATGRTERIP